VTSGSGWPQIPENEYHVTPAPRIHQRGAGLRSRINARPPETATDYRDVVGRYGFPVVSHEIGQWCVYPNFAEVAKYTGSLKPRNFEIFRQLLDDAHMLDQAEAFLMASGKLQALCYKEEIESALRTPGFGGFQLLDLHDFPGQGTALVGVLDPFWDSKPYISPQEFRRFCGPTVPLARMIKRIYTSDETLVADVEVSHFGAEPLDGATVTWRLSDVARGSLPPIHANAGELKPVGRIEIPLQQVTTAQQLRLEVAVDSEAYVNGWDVWVYPPATQAEPPADRVLVADSLSDALRRLEEGGRVVLLANPQHVKTDVQIGFSSIFWNTAWTGNQPPHTLGILCDPKHPALARFPTECHSNWQWWGLVTRSRPMELDGLPAALRPLVQVVPDWFKPQRLGVLFEARVGQGKLLVCSMDLSSELANRPVARQMRQCLLQYAAGEQFQPQVAVSPADIRSLFRSPPTVQRLGATITADSSHRDYPPQLAIDGIARTIWHTDWEPTPAPMPHDLTLDLEQPQQLVGLTYTPRQDMSNGRISQYSVSLSADGRQWGEAVASGRFPRSAELQTVRWDPPRTARYLRLEIMSEVDDKPFASVAELDVILAKMKAP